MRCYNKIYYTKRLQFTIRNIGRYLYLFFFSNTIIKIICGPSRTLCLSRIEGCLINTNLAVINTQKTSNIIRSLNTVAQKIISIETKYKTFSRIRLPVVFCYKLIGRFHSYPEPQPSNTNT